MASHSHTIGLRRLVEWCVVGLLALLLVRTWHVEWFEVQSGSMAPTLLGPHSDIACSHCGFVYQVDGADSNRALRKAVCPNCFTAGNELSRYAVARGDRLLVNKAAFVLRDPRRWDVVALRHPEHPSIVLVKRIVGLPGEQITLAHGDVFVNGAIASKPLAILRQMATTVYDGQADHATGHARWRGAHPTHWQTMTGGWSCLIDAGTTRPDEIDWLVYHHERMLGGGVREPAAISSIVGYNQPRPVLKSYDVAELLLSFRIDAFGAGQLWLRVGDAGNPNVVLEPARGRVGVGLLGGPIEWTNLPGTWPRFGGWKVELAVADQQMVLAVDGEVVLSHPLEESQASAFTTPASTKSASTTPVAIGAANLTVGLAELVLSRDVYYEPARGSERSEYQLGPDEYLVLGDNSPVSSDSRMWHAAARVDRSLLVGRAFFVHQPSRASTVAGWPIQVPDFAKIRYIR
jgi:signal peptidase I